MLKSITTHVYHRFTTSICLGKVKVKGLKRKVNMTPKIGKYKLRTSKDLIFSHIHHHET